MRWGGGGKNQWEHHIIFTNYEVVHPTVVSENYSLSGLLTILLKEFKIRVVNAPSFINGFEQMNTLNKVSIAYVYFSNHVHNK